MVFCQDCNKWHEYNGHTTDILKMCPEDDVVIETNITIKEYFCSLCKKTYKLEELKNIKRCPKCEMISIKMSGCNRITCFRCS